METMKTPSQIYYARYERLNAENGEVKKFSDFCEAKACCEKMAEGLERSNGEKDKCPQIRYYVIPDKFDEDEGPNEIYTTEWYWEA